MTHRMLLDGGEVEYELLPAAASGAPPLVFLHEGLGSLALWRTFPATLAARTGRAALVWSRHGHGHSAPATLPRPVCYLHHEAIAVLPELLAGLSLSDPVLVGHSDGASIALIHAAARRWPVAGVVALAPHVVVEERSIAGIEAARDAYRRDDRLRERMRRYHTDPDATFWGWNDVWLDPAFRSWNIEACLPEITCPVLVVQCADDPYGTLDQVERIEAGVTAPVERLVLPAGGHAPHLRHAGPVVDAVAGFVAAMDRPAPM